MPESDLPVRAGKLGLGAAAIWLILLICFTVGIAIVIFSATQFQTRLANLALKNGALSIWRADQLREEWARNLAALEAVKKARDSKRLELDKQTVFIAVIDANKRALTTLIINQQASLAVRISRVDADLAREINRTPDFFDVMNLIYSKIGDLRTKDSEIDASIDGYNDARRKWNDSDNQWQGASDRKKDLQQELIFIESELKATQANAHVDLSAYGGDSIGQEQQAQIENAIFEFQTMYQNYPFIYYVALAPSDFLILVLVIAMGVLGSSLQLGYVYTTEFARRPTTFYLFRPALGVITALVIFIAAKAGIPLVTDTSRLGTNAPINPYFISFLAIISGLM